jgi:hypothetical protein
MVKAYAIHHAFSILIYCEVSDQFSHNCIFGCFIAVTYVYIDKCFIVSCKFHEVWFVKNLFTVEEMNSDTSIINNECGFGMPSDSLGKSLMFTRENRRPFVDILLGSAKGK